MQPCFYICSFLQQAKRFHLRNMVLGLKQKVQFKPSDPRNRHLSLYLWRRPINWTQNKVPNPTKNNLKRFSWFILQLPDFLAWHPLCCQRTSTHQIPKRHWTIGVETWLGDFPAWKLTWLNWDPYGTISQGYDHIIGIFSSLWNGWGCNEQLYLEF